MRYPAPAPAPNPEALQAPVCDARVAPRLPLVSAGPTQMEGPDGHTRS